MDDVSVLNMYLKDKSAFTGAINIDSQKGDVYVEIEDGSTWTLTADSYVSGWTVSEGSSINLNGHKLYVDGKEYSEGSSSKGTAFEVKTESSGGGSPDGQTGDGSSPEGQPGSGNGGPGAEKPNGNPPEKPDGNPPSKPDN